MYESAQNIPNNEKVIVNKIFWRLHNLENWFFPTARLNAQMPEFVCLVQKFKVL
jgi:hypothetical protein